MFSNRIHLVWYDCYQYLETRNSSFCVTALYTYIFESLRYRNKGIEKRKQYIRAVV